jgi:hypothetical protein
VEHAFKLAAASMPMQAGDALDPVRAQATA